MSYADEAYKRITGVDPPKPWAERTEEERLQARDRFIETVNNSSDEDDAAIDQLFEFIRRNRLTPEPHRADLEETA